jgi:DNA-binding NarL/FixJ family response regulator
VVVLTLYEDANLVREMLLAGAAGYLTKRAAESELIAAIRAVAAEHVYVGQEMRRLWPMFSHDMSHAASLILGSALRMDPRPAESAPSFRETEIKLLRLLARGFSMQQTAEALQLDPESAEGLRQELLARLGLRSRVDIMHYIKEQGLLAPE